jgi:hypothetical protein
MHARRVGRDRLHEGLRERADRRGVPVTQVAAPLGHSRKSQTLDTYSHVLID